MSKEIFYVVENIFNGNFSGNIYATREDAEDFLEEVVQDHLDDIQQQKKFESKGISRSEWETDVIDSYFVTEIEYKVKDLDINTSQGFFSILFDSGDELQCCLLGDEENEEYIEEIDGKDTGFDEGICGEVNSWLIDTEGWVKEDLIIYYAKKAGVKVR